MEEGLRSGGGKGTPFTIKGERMLGDKRIRFIDGCSGSDSDVRERNGILREYFAHTRNSGAT